YGGGPYTGGFPGYDPNAAGYDPNSAGYGTQPGQGYPTSPGAAALSGFGSGSPGGFGTPGADGQPGPGRKSRKGLISALVGGALVLGLIAGGIGGVIGAQVRDNSAGSTIPSGPLGGDPNSDTSAQPPAPAGSTQEVAAKVLPSVVSIDVVSGSEEGEGSGVVLTPDGVIMTNNHVVTGQNGAAASTVQVNFHDGSRATARVLGADALSDIAVIKVDKSGLTPITVGTSRNLAVGQDVIAIGAPLGLEGTVTTGIISALNRPVSTLREERSGSNTAATSVIDAIQTDAAINPGNSGGALVNARGALIGVNSAIATLGGSEQQQSGSIGLGFAIPIDQAIRVAKQLQTTGKATHASLGVTVRPSSDLDTPGALIADVTPGGAAQQAGIPKGAVVTKVDERNIASADALVAAVRSHAPNDKVAVTYTVDGQPHTATVTLGTLSAN
ncbi:MAG: trypsin-like peptidase domain-containing protein, partial [Gordonia sp. (in: high G+C Gram-positive bacteria)]